MLWACAINQTPRQPILAGCTFFGMKQKSRLWCVGTKNGRREYYSIRCSAIIPVYILAQKAQERKLLSFLFFRGWLNSGKRLFYFFGIGGTNPAPFDPPKSPSGIPSPNMYKNTGQNRTPYPETTKKRPGHTAQALRFILT